MRVSARPLLSVVAMVASMAVTTGSALANWPHDPTIDLPLAVPSNGGAALATIPDGAGGAIVTWVTRTSFTNEDIFVQRVDAHGNRLWNPAGSPVCTAWSNQEIPTVTTDGMAGVIVTWHDYRSGSAQIYAQSIDSSGVARWTTDGIPVSPQSAEQFEPTIAADGSGGVYITWITSAGSNTHDVYAQHLNSAGVALWAAGGLAVCTASGDKDYPVVISDGSGGAIIAWQNQRGPDYDVYVQRISGSGVPQWTPDGVALCTAIGNQYNPLPVSDGTGGAIVTWYDNRGSTWDIYAQRVSSAGTPSWTANGVPVCVAASNQLGPVIAQDGSGGAYIAWTDYRGGTTSDLYAQRVSSSGARLWQMDGVVLCAAPGSEYYPSIIADGVGGAIVAWQDQRRADYDIYAQRVNGAGAIQWAPNGAAVCTDSISQYQPVIASDGQGGAILAWEDDRYSAPGAYAERIDGFGQLGNPEPSLSGVGDVPADQGGTATVSWSASYLDTVGVNGIASYEIERASPPAYNWQVAGTLLATQQTAYSHNVSTVIDSTGLTNPLTRFIVRALPVSGPGHWDSAPAEGYSVDNLAPATPASLAGDYSNGATNIHWDRSVELDFATYDLYRGDDPDFTPDSSNLIASQPDTGYSDAGPPGSCYKLSALDIHGNESPFAVLTPGTTLDAPGPHTPRVFSLASPHPNPAVSGAMLSFAIPRKGFVTLSVYGMDGRRVRTLRAQSLEAGAYEVAFNLSDNQGRRIPSGMYVLRLDANGRTLTRRLAILK